MTTRNEYRTLYNSKTDDNRSAVYFPASDIVWTLSRAERTRARIAEIDESPDELTEQMLAERDALAAELADWGKAIESGDKPVCFVPIGEKSLREIQEKLGAKKITETEYEARLLIKSVYVPQTDGDGALILQDGMPTKAEPLWEITDMEFLCADDHLPGGWLRRWKDRLAEVIAETLVELEVGNSARG